MKKITSLLAAIEAIIYLTGTAVAADMGKVKDVSVSVTSETRIPSAINQRMEKSIKSIGQELLLEKDVNDIRENTGNYEKIIQEVFDKVLVGYSVDKVNLVTDKSTHISVELQPWHDEIKEVQVELIVEGMAPLLEQMVRKDMTGIEQVFSDTLTGLPVGAIDWSNGVLKQNVNAFMEDKLPEFRADFDIVEVAENSKVKLTVYPLLPVVRTMELRMRSDTVPNFTLLTQRRKLQDEANKLIGLPVAFVNRHKTELETNLSDTMDNTKGFRFFGMKTESTLEINEKMSLMSRSNTPKLRVRGESWKDIGHRHYGNKHSSRWRGHLGWMPTSREELFIEGDLYPFAGEWGINLHGGYMYNIDGGLWAGVKYDFRNAKPETEIKYVFDKRWSVRHEYRKYDNQWEAGVRYKLHDYMALEAVRDKDGGWLRIIGTI